MSHDKECDNLKICDSKKGLTCNAGKCKCLDEGIWEWKDNTCKVKSPREFNEECDHTAQCTKGIKTTLLFEDWNKLKIFKSWQKLF